jgi:hypothetical protein
MNTKTALPITLSLLAGGAAWWLVEPAWVRMWCLAAALFFMVKAMVMAKTGAGDWRFVLLWPGMDARAFERTGKMPNTVYLALGRRAAWDRSEAVSASLKKAEGETPSIRPTAESMDGAKLTVLGKMPVPHTKRRTRWQNTLKSGLINLVVATCLLLVARFLVAAPYWSTWLAIIALILALHCGVFALLAAAWIYAGRDARPIMNAPLMAASVTEFWGERWNVAFRDAALELIVKSLRRRLGRTAIMLVVFVVSGLAHELVITVPAGRGYGGPLLYFVIQGLAVWWERGCSVKQRWFWRLRAWVVLVGPLPLLVPETFVLHVMHPFFQTLNLLP